MGVLIFAMSNESIFFDEIFIFVNSSKIKMNKTNVSFLFCFLFFAYTDNTICSVLSVGTKIKCEL